ncbi:MAG: hypothetical protein M1444_01400 [Patescibacteria group bacterium]|nr:hypothetical protein [Patescibacteria group bacterium]
MFKTLKIENLKLKIVLFLLISLIFSFNTASAGASFFASAYVRLDNQSSSAPLSGAVCAEPSSAGAGTENKIVVTFPSDFTVSSNTSNWTTSIANLPSGATVWPSIGATATNISGQSVTFSSGDLTTNTLYCFNFTGNASTTGSTGTDKTGIITTKNSSGTTIDSTTYAVSIVSNNQINITASVDPQVSDLPIAIESTTTGTQFAQNTTISYQITYGSTNVSSVPLTIQAQWSQGTVQGSPVPSVDILDYVVGSAGNAYNSTAPVVDTVNRTITWTISSIPGNTTGKTVTFSLKTNSNYTGGNNVSFTISARAVSGSTVTADKTVAQNYLYSGASTTSTTATATPTRTPAVIPQPLSFSDISIRSVSQSDASIAITTNSNATLVISYGTSPNLLSQTIKTLTYQTQNIIALSDLLPDTNYYFTITAKNTSGNFAVSDIFTFTTAVISKTPEVNLTSLVITSKNTVLLNPLSQPTPNQPVKNIIVIPESNVFEIQFSVSTSAKIKSIQLVIRNKKVLGASTFGPRDTNASSNFVNLAETQPGIYRGRLLSNQTPGIYELYARIADFNGNIVEQKISDIKIVNSFKVFEKGTKKPIENARVAFYLYSPTTKIYDLISPAILPIENPSYSGLDGAVSIVLPEGHYKADISAIGYRSQTVKFNLGVDSGDYPTVYLQSQPVNLLNTATYLGSTLIDSLALNAQFLKYVASSNRFFTLLTVLAWVFFIFLAYFSFSARTHISITSIPYFFLHKLKLALPWTSKSIVVVKIIDNETKEPVSKTVIFIIDPRNNKILLHSKTDKRGEFYFHKLLAEEFKISVMKKGFLANGDTVFKQQEMNKMPLILSLEKDKNYKKPLVEWVFLYVEGLIGIFLEFILVTSLIFQIFFIFTFGFVRIAPFLFISSLNIILLFLYVYKPRSLEA